MLARPYGYPCIPTWSGLSLAWFECSGSNFSFKHFSPLEELASMDWSGMSILASNPWCVEGFAF
jgi:hypothetical protein